MQRGFQYIHDIKSGKIPSCEFVKQAVKRFETDLQRDDLYFNEQAVQRVIQFVEATEHFTGRFTGKKFILEPWQVFIIMNLYGFYWESNKNKRRFRNGYIEMARKQGKTSFVAVLGLYSFIADGEGAAEVLIAANSKEQAKVAFDIARKYAKRLDPKEKLLRSFRSEIFFNTADSRLKVLAADDTKLDGFNASMVIVDEYHAAKSSKVRDVLKSSMVMRENPMILTITTAGFDKATPCYELRTTCTEILSGAKQDDSLFTIIYTLDKDDNWQDSEVWQKCSPNIGVTVMSDSIQIEVNTAVNSPSEEVGVKTKTLNIWCDSAETWIPDEYVLKATEDFTIPDGCQVYVGVDLAESRDLTAVSYMWIQDDKNYFYTDFYIPQDCLTTHPNREIYKPWVRQKHVKATPGNVTDYDYIIADILAVADRCEIEFIAYDTWNAKQWAIKCTDEGLPLEPYSQTVPNFNNTTKEFERLILSGGLRLANNPAMRFCLRNVQLKRDWNGNVKPNKGIDKKKIDGVISALQALDMQLIHGNDSSGNIY